MEGVFSMKAISYDLWSEHHISLSPDQRSLTNACRSYSVTKLHSLGVGWQDSLILVSPRKEDKIEEIITKVNARYTELSANIGTQTPISIEVLELTEAQGDIARRQSIRYLTRKIDEAINRLNTLINGISGLSQERRRNMRYSLEGQSRDWAEVQETTRELGLEGLEDLDYVINLVDDARRRLGL